VIASSENSGTNGGREAQVNSLIEVHLLWKEQSELDRFWW
jgi:hypothetical protein